jgi:hypothetical protein
MNRTLSAVVLCTVLAAPAAAGTLAGMTLPDTVQVDGHTLVLNGLGLRKKFVVKVYVGGLYLPAKTRDAARILGADEPRRGVLHFLYGVSKEQMCEAWDEGLAANTPNASAEVKAGFDRLCSLMADVEKGDEIAFAYLPDRGTEISVRGQSQGTIAGKPFADALFACWLGPKPGPGEEFKQALLGG